MKVQELIDRLADFRGDADVVFWVHHEESNKEICVEITEVFRDREGKVGINWNEDAHDHEAREYKINNE